MVRRAYEAHLALMADEDGNESDGTAESGGTGWTDEGDGIGKTRKSSKTGLSKCLLDIIVMKGALEEKDPRKEGDATLRAARWCHLETTSRLAPLKFWL